MTRRKLRITDVPPEHIGAARDMDQADAIFKRTFSGNPPATRQEFAPSGLRNRVRWMMDKVMLREAAL